MASKMCVDFLTGLVAGPTGQLEPANDQFIPVRNKCFKSYLPV